MRQISLLIAGLWAIAWSANVQAEWTYAFTDVGQLGSWGSTGRAINNNGQVVGGSSKKGTQSDHAYRWTPGAGMIGLGTLGGTESRSFGISSTGAVVGTAAPSGGGYPQRHAFLWGEGTGMQDLGTLGAGTSEAYKVNSSRQVIGTSNDQPFFWQPGSTIAHANTILPSGSGWTIASVNGINDAGSIVGTGITPAGYARAYLLNPRTSIRDLGSLGDSSSARDINSHGTVVGTYYPASSGEQRSFVWSDANGMTDIGTLGLGGSTTAIGINDAGQIVGQSGSSYFLWSSGSMLDLNNLILGSGWSIDTITGISDYGIVGTGVRPGGGYKHAFVLTVTPEPATFSLLILGGMAILRKRRRAE